MSESGGLADIDCLRALIADGGKFFLIAKPGTLDIASDEPKNKALYDNLGSTDTDKRVQAVLDYIYRVRCNVFHGGKDLTNKDQLEILQPSIRCLKRIIEAGMDELIRQSQNSAPAAH